MRAIRPVTPRPLVLQPACVRACDCLRGRGRGRHHLHRAPAHLLMLDRASERTAAGHAPPANTNVRKFPSAQGVRVSACCLPSLRLCLCPGPVDIPLTLLFQQRRHDLSFTFRVVELRSHRCASKVQRRHDLSGTRTNALVSPECVRGCFWTKSWPLRCDVFGPKAPECDQDEGCTWLEVTRIYAKDPSRTWARARNLCIMLHNTFEALQTVPIPSKREHVDGERTRSQTWACSSSSSSSSSGSSWTYAPLSGDAVAGYALCSLKQV